MARPRRQAGQVLVLVPVALLALIGSAVLVLLAGSAASQRNQLQSLADTSALDSALKIGIGCNSAMASTVITEADNFMATQRTRTGSLAIAAGTCTTPYHGTDTFAGGLSADYYYPYRAHQQQVREPLTLRPPTSFGSAVGAARPRVPDAFGAGVGAQPVPPLSSVLAPDPNADPAAISTLQGTGGSACSAAGVYPNIVAGGITWGTGQAPAPTKDAAGFWHFKPSCYGYLTLGNVAGGITAKQIGAESAVQNHFITGTLPVASTAGTLLVATINSLTTPNKFAGPPGWTSAAEIDNPAEGRSEIWYYPNNPGGISSATFTMNPATVGGAAQITEWNGAATIAPLDQTGTTSISVPASSATTSTVGAMAQSGARVMTNIGCKVAVGNTYSTG